MVSGESRAGRGANGQCATAVEHNTKHGSLKHAEKWGERHAPSARAPVARNMGAALRAAMLPQHVAKHAQPWQCGRASA